MKKLLFIIGGIISIFPCLVFADNSNNEDIVTETKYYKTITYNYGFSDTNSIVYNPLENNYSYTQEISEDEYNSVIPTLDNILLRGNGYTETTYKKMTTSISANGSKYKYQVVLNWKLMPATRSYDIIGIGHYQSVKLSGNANFLLTYDNQTSSSASIYTSSTGTTATFQLPTGSISSLSAKLYFNVEKNVNATILTQKAFGDYAHATSTISLTNAKKHTIGTNGIVHESSVSSYFDTMSTATATWSGSW